MKEGRKGKGLRLFSLLPIVKVRTGSILIGSSSLYEILNICLDSYCTTLKNFPTSLGTFLKEDAFWWKQLFNYDKFESMLSLFQFILKDPAHNNTFDDHGYTVDKKNYDILDLSNSVIIGVDPGRRDVFVAAKYPSDITKHEEKNMKQKQKKEKEKKKRKKKRKKTSVQGEGNILIEKSVQTRNVEENAQNNVHKNVNKRRRRKLPFRRVK
ncbi:hypothetical protein MP638_004816 [Amoeboaphelidium occidentale]|nr:hypothetical protein MP638_004816 [Amoeboaphelidium occidentale]